tara:strand:- start:3 stop:374 length:372 start_codon:yes stop_codon:yes gene_type:complete
MSFQNDEFSTLVRVDDVTISDYEKVIICFDGTHLNTLIGPDFPMSMVFGGCRSFDFNGTVVQLLGGEALHQIEKLLVEHIDKAKKEIEGEILIFINATYTKESGEDLTDEPQPGFIRGFFTTN